MRKALFPGTFDPPSHGHLDLIKRASMMCDRLYVAVAVNLAKHTQALFSVEERLEMLKTITQEIQNVEIISFQGLAVDFAKKIGAHYVFRGLRSSADFDYECRMAFANRKLGGLETLFLMADEKFAHISATLIRELCAHKRSLHEFVPKAIEERVHKKWTT